MKYAVIRDEHGNEIPLVFGNSLNPSKLKLLGTVVAAGEANVHHMTITCDGFLMVDNVEIGSRGLKDEILIRSSDFVGTIDEA